MDVLIISHFGSTYSESDNDRFLYLAKILACENDVEIVTSSFCHEKKEHRRNVQKNWPFKITFIEEKGYKKNICISRFYSHLLFGINLEKYLKKRKKPDVIYCAVPSLYGPYLVAKFCEKKDIRFIIDIQDLWPEAFKMVLNYPLISDVIFAPFKYLADGIYKRADTICAVSNTYCQRAKKVNKRDAKMYTVFLGTELLTFDRYAKQNPILKKGKDEIWLAYCGTLGDSYDLISVFDALEKLANPNVKFIIMGDGPKQNEFETYARDKNINAIFVGRLDYKEMCSLLAVCDITVNPIMHMAAQSIINKHADYAAVGLPVVSTQENDEYRALIDEYKMGFNCKNNDSSDLAKKLKELIDNPELRKEMGSNSRRCAEEKFDRKISYALLINTILNKES